MVKKLFSILTVIVLLLAVSFNAFAAGTLSANSVSAKTGDEFTVEVKLSGNPGIIATRIIIDYDSKYLSLQKAENGNVFPQSKALFGKDFSELPYKMLWDDALGTNITANGNLAVLTFKVKAEAPSGKTSIKISVDSSSTFDENLEEKSISDAVCTVSFPTVSKTEKDTSKPTETKKTDAETAKTTEKTTEQTTKASTTKASTTKPKSPVTSPTTPTATKVQEEILGTKATTTEKTTAKTDEKANATTAADETVMKTEAVTEPFETNTAPQESVDTVGTLSQAEDVTEEVTEDSVQTEKESKKQYLWFLIVIPVAGAIIIIIKKAGAKNVK